MIHNSELKILIELVAIDGLVKPKDVVESARPEDSPLHGYFTWENNDAADRWREAEARELIRSVLVTVHTPKPELIRAFVSLPVDRDTGAGYRLITEVMDNSFLRRQLKEDILNHIRQWENKARLIGLLIDFKETKKVAENI